MPESPTQPPAAPSETPPPAPVEGVEELGEEQGPGLLGALLAGSASWLVSLCLHFIVILVLAAITLPSLPELELPNLTADLSEQEDALDDVPLLDFEEVDFSEELEPVDLSAESLVTEAAAQSFELSSAPSFVPLSDIGLTSAISGDAIESAGIGAGAGEAYGRGAKSRGQAVKLNGGSRESEEAVRLALEWIARHQNPDGSWSLAHHLGRCRGRCENPGTRGGAPTASLRSATGLALLPFLGAGQTHLEGKHKETVARGLRALIAMGQKNKKGPGASWMDQAGQLYSHGIASIVLTEALGITGDPELAPPAQAALDFITYAQGPDGGWRYRPKDIGDTSVTGWQVMALKSGFLANLRVSPNVARGAFNYLNTVQHNGGATYSYVANASPKSPKHGIPDPNVSAVGLLCRMYLGWQKENPKLTEGVRLLSERGPSNNDFYYNYYAAQVLFQHTSGKGKVWRDWNEKLREQLINQQETEGHARGSWFVSGPHANDGGRLYLTSLATMTLEVYYRYLPIYKLDTESVEFPE